MPVRCPHPSIRPFAVCCALAVSLLLRPTSAAAQFQFESIKLLSARDGYGPMGPMVQADDGWVYGLTVNSTSMSDYASVYRFNPADPDPAGSFATIANLFDYSVQNRGNWHGYAEGGMVKAADGNLYFVSLGSCGSGVFRVTPSGSITPPPPDSVTLLVNFPCAGAWAMSGLTVGPDGALYGIAADAGGGGPGFVYRVALDGALSTVISFPPDGFGPLSQTTFTPLTASSNDGRLYGVRTDHLGGGEYREVLFSVDPDPVAPSVHILYEFRTRGPNGERYPDGTWARGRLLEVPAETGVVLLGVTSSGGTWNAGVIFRVDVDVTGTVGTYSKLFDFNGLDACPGFNPIGGLIQGGDGLLYGTTAGSSNRLPGVFGTVYQLGADGVPTMVYGGNIQPFAPLLSTTDGSLYGSSYADPAVPPGSTWGSLFRLATAPQESTFTVNPAIWNAPAGGGTQSVTITATLSGASWTASSDQSWLTVSVANGTGSGSLTLRAAPTTSVASRTATATIAGQSVLVTQAGGAVTINWPAPSAIVYGTPLSGVQLNATASAAGTFTYTPAAGTILAAAAGRTLHVRFVPTDSEHYWEASADVSIDVLKAALQVSAENKVKILGAANPELTVSMTGFVPGDTEGVLSGAPAVTTVATTGSPVGTYPIVPAVGTLSAANYRFDFTEGTLSVVYASGGTCLGEPGHAILQPVNADGTSVFKEGRTVPAKFRVCDASGSSIGAPGTVTGFNLVQTISGTVSSSVNEPVDSSTPFTEFRWDASSQQWIFNMATRGLTAGRTYVFRITLNDATSIDFRFGIR